MAWGNSNLIISLSLGACLREAASAKAGEREGVRGGADLHPHLNPPPSEGRKIVGYLMVRGCPPDMG